MISHFKTVHGDRYDYSNVKFTSIKSKVEVICKIHGSYFPITYNHSIGQNCKKCADKTIDVLEFSRICTEIHNSKYDYSKVNYKNISDKVEIICPVHGSFNQTPRGHLHSKKGCPKCQDNRLKRLGDFIPIFISKHGDKYDYSKSIYKGNKNRNNV